jgi:Skp family chaperone for outer membrane proteins
VKKSTAALSGLIALGCIAAWAAAQTPSNPGATPNRSGVQQANATAPAASAMPSTRVGVLNINSVLKNYGKAQYLNSQIKMKVQSYVERMNKIREEVEKVQTEIKKPTTTAPMREQMEKQIVNLNRSLQDLDAEAKKKISEEQSTIAVQIFREIEQVVDAVAKTNNFDLVLSYPDATTMEEMYTQDNVVRKLASQAAIPLFYKKHIDLTDPVIKTLNASFPAPAAPAPASGAPTPAAPPPAPQK